MLQPADPAHLAEIRDAVARGQGLTDEQRRHLVSGFIFVNLILDLASLLDGLQQGWATPLTSTVSYDTLRRWMVEQPPTEAPATAFVIELERTSEQQGAAVNPWRVLNRWLGVEVVLEVIRRRTPGLSATVSMGAQRLFEQILQPSGLGPRACRERSRLATGLFTEWWRVSLNWLASWWERGPCRFTANRSSSGCATA